MMVTFAPDVNEYQMVLPMLPQGDGSPGSVVASAVLRLSVNGREATGAALAKSSFGGGVPRRLG